MSISMPRYLVMKSTQNIACEFFFFFYMLFNFVVHTYSDLGRLSELRRQEKSHSKKHHFVTVDWVKDSIESGIMRSERLYEPRAP